MALRAASLTALTAALIGCSSLLACSALSDASSQEADHTAGEPTFAAHPWLWADESEDEYKRNAAATSSWEEPEFLPMDHPMAQRLQFWVDRMDAALRAEFPKQLAATPQPRIIIRKTEDKNAWVSFIPVTWEIPARAGADAGAADVDGGDVDAAAPAPGKTVEAILLTDLGRISSLTREGFSRPFDEAKLGELTKFFNGGFEKCRLSVEGGEMVFGDDCVRRGLGAGDRAKKFAYNTTARHITFTSAYILMLENEDRIVSTLAHELGHFYRSHANMPSDVTNYFYAIDQKHAHKPKPAGEYLAQTSKTREKLRSPDYYQDWAEENALMRDQNLGFYTDEQEADELALELLSKVGISGEIAMDKIFVMLKEFGTSGDDALGHDECSKLREAGWKGADGKVASVPVGDPSNAHHSLCFRAFNVAQEIEAHKYQLAERPTPPGGEWSALFDAFAVELGARRAPGPDAGAPDASDAGAADAGN